MLGHCAPEAAVGGPLALLEEGDTITIDVPSRRIDAVLSEEEFAERRGHWRTRESVYKTGVFARYAACVSSASEGAVLRHPPPV